MALVILLVLITGLIFNGFRRNRKSNVRLQLKQSEVNLKNTSLEALNNKQQLLLQEKELLLREIHHRVKNNLQTTMSLLNMQTSYLSNNDAIEALRNSQQRIYSMSLVHQKLYQSDDLYTINMKDYIQELAGYLGENFGISGKITFQFNLDKIYMDLAQAIPVGLIVNESLTNALKYAFPGEKKGIIKIQLTKQANSELLLCISDDGIGLPDSIDYEPSRTLGLNLITGLASQLQGSVEIQKTLGMSLLIRFKNNEQTDEDINDDICV
jgi:two-component sensor histidine kinase